jgi:uncharacterized cupin superfamily protein
MSHTGARTVLSTLPSSQSLAQTCLTFLSAGAQKFTAFSLDDFVAGKSKSWTFWDCDPSEFPWTYSKDEYAYVLEGQFYVTYEGTSTHMHELILHHY